MLSTILYLLWREEGEEGSGRDRKGQEGRGRERKRKKNEGLSVKIHIYYDTHVKTRVRDT